MTAREPNDDIFEEAVAKLADRRNGNGVATHSTTDRRDADGHLVRGRDGLPRVERGKDIHRVIADLEEALAETDPRIFQRGHELVIVRGATAEDAARLKIKFAPSDLVIAPLRSAALVARVTEHVDYGYWGFDETAGPNGKRIRHRVWKADLPSGTVLAALLGAAYWSHIQPLRGVAVTPIMHLDGSVTESGYDVETGCLVASNIALPTIAEYPTRDDAKAALATLFEPFEEFPFETEAERYTPVALVLTLLLRPVIRGNCPAFVTSAPQKNCGKSLAVKAACTMATGRVPAGNTWAKSSEEQEKQIGAAAYAGGEVLFFDNVEEGAVVGGAPLDKVLTCDGRNSFRVLGRTELKSLPWMAVVAFTANRVRIGGDSDRRVVLSTLIRRDAPIAHKHEELIAHIERERPRLLAAAFTLIRAWILAGSDRAEIRRLDSFERWAWTVASMIRWAGGGDVRELVRDTVGTDRDVDEATFLEELHRYLAVNSKPDVTVAQLMADVFGPGRRRHDFGSLREAIEALTEFAVKDEGRKLNANDPLKTISSRLGQRLRGMNGVVHGEYRLREAGKTHGRVRWRVDRRGGPGAPGGAYSASSQGRPRENRAGAAGENGPPRPPRPTPDDDDPQSTSRTQTKTET